MQPEQARRVSHYTLQEKIGEGGMGIVYRAWDETLHRDVALKFLPADLVGNAERRSRFLREARATAAVTHPNIAAIYEAGEADGELFLAMELVKGTSLRDRLSDGPMPIAEAVDCAAEVADGLSRAHESRIVHRDLKPENIFLSEDGHPKILDFGLAKVLKEDTPAPSDLSAAETASMQLTRQGATLGTPVYMSPEQARGDAVDFRTDIFSFGTTVYEMVTGKTPFRRGTMPDTLSAILNDPAPAPSEVDSHVPRPLERLLLRCLEKDPDRRYQQTSELARDLHEMEAVTAPLSTRLARTVGRRATRWLPAAIVIAVTLALGLNVGGIRDTVTGIFVAKQRIDSVAVLPLQNLSGDPTQEYFASGIHEALIGKLAKIGSVNVISRTSVAQFKETELTLPEIAEKLNVDAIVEGSVLRVTNRVAVSARLFDASREEQLWSQDFEHDLLDVLNLPNDVARSIAHSIHAELTPEEQRRMDSGGPVDPEAYDLYLRGRYELAQGFSSVEVEKALDYFQRAADLESDFALAHAAIAEVFSRLVSRFSPEEAISRGQEAGLRAITLDDSLGIAHAALGKIKYLYERDWIGAEDLLRAGVERDPDNVAVLQMYGMYLLLAGRYDEGVEFLRSTVSLDPLTLTTQQHLALGYAWARRWDEAIVEYDRLIEMIEQSPNPTVGGGVHYQLANTYMFAGHFDEAREHAEAINLFSEPIWISVLEGDRDAGYEQLEWMEKRDPQKIDHMNLAILCALLGEDDKAFAALDVAVGNDHPYSHLLNVLPPFDSLRADPRFDDMLSRVGIPPLEEPAPT